ncbi:MAG: protease pro-enzyme activation domain-containing protein, partial [Acidobacteriota bacterium]
MHISSRVVSLPIAVALLCASLFGAVADRIAAKPDIGRRAVLKGRTRPEATSRNDRGPVDPSLRIDYATLYLKPAAGLDAFLTEQQNPGSPEYHRWLTPEQFGERFGLSAGDTGQIAAWLQSQGLTVHEIARGKHWITFSGTAARVGQAFQTELHRYVVNGVPHFANASDPSIPAAFENVVGGIEGLHDFVPEPMHRLLPADSQP